MRKTLKDIVKLFSAKTLVALIGLASTAFLLRIFEKQEIAVIPAFQMIGALSSVVFGMGLGPTMIKTVPSLLQENSKEAFRICKTYFLISIIGVLIFSTIVYFVAVFISDWVFKTDSYQPIIKIMSVGFVGTGLFQICQFLCRAQSRFHELSVAVVTNRVLVVIFTVGLSLSHGVIGLTWGLTCSALLSSLVFIYLIRDVVIQLLHERMYSFRLILKDSWAFYLESYLMYFRSEGDNLVVASVLGTEYLSLYFVAKKVYSFMDGFYQSLDNVLTSKLAVFKNNVHQYSLKAKDIQLITSNVLLPAIILSAAVIPSFILVLAGPSYSNAILPAILLTFVPFCDHYFGLVYSRAIFIFMPSVERFKLSLLNTGFLLLFLFLLGSYFSVVGVGIARLLTTIVVGIYSYSIVNRNIFRLQINYGELVQLFLVSAAVALPLIFVQLKYPGNFIIIFLGGLASVALFIIVIHFTMSEKFYGVLNKVSPIVLKDPIKVLRSMYF